MQRVLDWVERIFLWAGVVLLAAMFLVVCLQVFTRYVLLSPLSWTEETGRYLFAWASFLGSAVLVGRSEHFSIDLIVRLLPPRTRRGLRIGVTLLVIGFALLMVIYGLSVSRRLLTASSPVLQVSLGVVYGIIPISGLYMFLHGLVRLGRLVSGSDATEKAS